MLTAELIRSLAPRARQDYVDALVNGSDILEKSGINTSMRLAQFMANACHETDGLTIVRENMNYSAEQIAKTWPARRAAIKLAHQPQALANSVYGDRMGNRPGSDDGWNFRGCGLMQTTGRENFERFGQELGLPLGEHPEMLEVATNSLKASCLEFAKFVSFCDRGEAGYRAVCNGINRGQPTSKLDPIGWNERQLWFKRWCDALGASVVADDSLELGDHGALVSAFQERLAALGYAVGRHDGIYGSRMRAGVLAFQAESRIALTGTINSETRRALNSETAARMPVGERSEETVADLKEQGSVIVKAAGDLKKVGVAVAGVSAAGGTAQNAIAPAPDIIAQTKNVVTEIGSWKAITSGISETVAWATSQWWILGVVAAFLVYRYGRTIELRRLFDHQTGAHLGR